MKTITLKIAAGASEEIAVTGDYVRIKDALVEVRIQADDGAVDARIEKGDALNLQPFQRLRVSHDSGSEQTIILLIGDGSSADSSKVGGSLGIDAAAAMLQTAPAVGVASASILAANAARRFLMVQNKDPAANVFLNLAGAAATVAGGVQLAPGASLLLDVCAPTSEIFAISDAAMTGAVIVVAG